MCGCEHHWDTNGPCTCTCPEHESIRDEMRRRAIAAPAPVPDDGALARWLHDYGLCKEIAHHDFEHVTEPPSSPCWVFARAILASDWLRAHTAAAVDVALAQQREGLAEAIENLVLDATFRSRDFSDGFWHGNTYAARVVREFGEGR